jgi:beta-aspartyl-dipeptidase (metallo-type)
MLTLISNARVFAPRELGVMDVCVAGGRIVCMGSGAPEVADELIDERLDAAGATLIPGLIDGHAHTTGGGGEAGAETRVPASSLSDFSTSGVTSVVGMLGTDSETRSMEALCARTRALRAEGLSAWCLTGGYHHPARTLTGSLRGDLVHLDAVIGVGELALSDFRSSQLTLDELLRIASEVQVGSMLAGKPAVLHLHLGDGERGLELVRRALAESELPAPLFNPTHVNRQAPLFDEALDLAERGCVIDITAFPVEAGDGALSAADALEHYLATDLDPTRVTVSSDSGGCLPIFDVAGRMSHMEVGGSACLLETLRELVGRGHGLADVLPAFTSNPGRHLCLGQHLRPNAVPKGQLSPGADADLVLLDADLSLLHVMAGGRWLVIDGKPEVKGTFE